MRKHVLAREKRGLRNKQVYACYPRPTQPQRRHAPARFVPDASPLRSAKTLGTVHGSLELPAISIVTRNPFMTTANLHHHDTKQATRQVHLGCGRLLLAYGAPTHRLPSLGVTSQGTSRQQQSRTRGPHTTAPSALTQHVDDA
jgi:hypothetical protein